MPNQSARFDADAEYYTHTLSPVLGTTFTVVVWARIAVDRNTWSTFVGLDNGGSTGAIALQAGSSGTSIVLAGDGSTDLVVHSATVGTWYCYSLTRSALSGAGAIRVRYGTSPASLTAVTATPSGGMATSTFDVLRLGDSGWSGEWLNGNIAMARVYTRVLTDTEIETELGYYEPISTTGLYGAWSFWDGPTTTDVSGNGRTLIGGSGATAESGPAGVSQNNSAPPSGMPSVRSRTSGAQNTAVTSHSVSLPAGVAAGDLLLVGFSNDESTDPTTVSTTSTGWTLLGSIEQGTTTNHRCSVFWKRATGSDALTVTTAFAQESTHVSICAQNAGDPVLVSNSGGSATSAAVTAHSGLTSGNYLSVLFCGTDSSTTTSQAVTAPSGYANVVSQNPSVTSSAATFSMDQVLTGVTSISPGAITLSAAEQWVTFHIAAVGTTSGPEPGRFLLSR